MPDKWYDREVLSELEKGIEAKLDLAADIAVGEIKTRTPVDTGNLKGSNTWKRNGKLSRRVFNNTEYGPHVEFGTKKMKPQPFMRPGFRAAIPKIKRLFAK